MADQNNQDFQPLNIPETQEYPAPATPEVTAPATELRKPSFGLSMAATAYGVLAEGTSATIGRAIDTSSGVPDLNGTIYDSKYTQDEFNQQWNDAGITDKPIDVSKYNKVAAAEILDYAKRRQAMKEIQDATQSSIIGSGARGIASLGLGLLDPINLAAGLVPAAGLFEGFGLTGIANGVRALDTLSTDSLNVGTRIAARFGSGAVAGTIGNVPIEAVTAPLRSQMGEDYHAQDTMYNLAFGFALGGGLHVLSGAFGKNIIPREDNSTAGKFIDTLDDQQKAQYLNDQGSLNTEGINELKKNTSNVAYNNPEITDKIFNSDNLEVKQLGSDLIEATTKMSPEPSNIGELSLKSDLINSFDKVFDQLSSDDSIITPSNISDSYVQSDNLNPNVDNNVLVQNNDSIPAMSPATEKLSDFISQKTTTPRMITEVFDNYNKIISKLQPDELLTSNKSELLDQAMANVKPNAPELASIATPETRQKVMQAAIGQMADGKMPTVDAMLRSDPNIDQANLDDIRREALQADNISNHYENNGIPPMENFDSRSIPFENEEDYFSSNKDLDNKIKNIEELSKLGLYSKSANEAIITDNDNVNFDKTIPGTENVIGNNPGINTKRVVAKLVLEFGNDAMRMMQDGKLNIVENISDLPGTHEGNIKGLFYKGKAYLIAKNLTTEQVKGVTLHEIGVHSNMDTFLGRDGYTNLIDQMNKLLTTNEDLARVIDANIPLDTLKQFRNEERLAYLIEELPDSGFIQSMLSKVKSWLYTKFPSMQNYLQLSDQDIGHIALASLRNFARSDVADRRYGEVLYSKDSDIIQESQNEIDLLNKIIKTTSGLRNTLLNDANTALSMMNNKSFKTYLQRTIPDISDNDSNSIYKDISKAYTRNLDSGISDPGIAAINYAIDKLENSQKKYKLTLVHDTAIKQRMLDTIKQWAGNEKQGLNSLLVGSVKQRQGSRAYTAGAEIMNMQRLHLGNLLADLDQNNLLTSFYRGTHNDNIMRAMELIEDNKSTSHLPNEAITIAKSIQKAYDGITNDMRKNGLPVNKVKRYFANQQYSHNEMKIKAAGYDHWRAVIDRNLDYQATADAAEISISDINDEFFQNVYNTLSGGLQNGSSASLSSEAGIGNSLRRITQKPRILQFKSADAAIDYKNNFGFKDFQAAVIGTIKSNGRKLGLLKTLGVNYERNLKQIAAYARDNAMTPESQKYLSAWISTKMLNQLESIDGRADRPVSEAWARFNNNVRAIKSMSSLGFAPISAISDVVNAASYINRMGAGTNTLVDSIGQLGKIFTKFSPERKQMLAANGVFAESVLNNAYRDSAAGSNWLSKSQGEFFKIIGMDAWQNSIRYNALDSLMNYMARFTDRTHEQLNPTLQRTLGLFNIDADDWNLMRQANTKQVDGNNYLVTQEFDALRPKIMESLKSKGISDDVLELATDKKLDNLKRNMYNFYMDGMSHMVLEPDAATKYYQTGGGLRPGTIQGELARYIMQFKSFSVGFMRKVLLDQIYERHDNFAIGNRLENGKWYQREWGNSYLTDMSSQGLMQKAHLAQYIAGLTIAGYASGVIKDLFKGKEPRPLYDRKGNLNIATLEAAFLQGGSLGIYGDFAFGNFNRFGGGLLDTAAGPVIGTLGSLAGIAASARGGLIGDPVPDVKSKLARLALQNTPFVNTFYASAAFNYLIANSIQEHLNPGSLRRMERNMLQQNNQKFINPPSQYLDPFGQIRR